MKKKKEKIIYIDDGRTIADMSGVSGGLPKSKCSAETPRASLKEQFGTFWAAMKMMLLPTLVAVGGIAVIYLVLSLIFWLI